MSRWFNTAGPCNPAKHYMLPSMDRLPSIKRLIEQDGYFVVHAPRQTGKTTAMLTLAQELTNEGEYAALIVSVEVGAAYAQTDAQSRESADTVILRAWKDAATFWLPSDLHPPDWSSLHSIGQALSLWARESSKPIVLFIDEIDSLQDDTLLSVLRQLRDGYPRRPGAFPKSLALIGLRDVRDYKVASGGSKRLGTASPFNIKVESLTLRNFTQAEVATLYHQHTADTGQFFTPAAVEKAYGLTQGQPWLVNALARQMVEQLAPDPATALTVEHVNQAKEILIQRQDTHLDSLAARLREPRIRAIIEPMLAGQELESVSNEDIEFVLDLGLCVKSPQGGLVIANPIYKEVLPRVLSVVPMASLPQIAPTWLTPEGKLDSEALLTAFLQFWRRHGDPLLKSAPYHEIAPHLVMMAFLHRVVNGGGTLDREYALGAGRMDLCLRYGQETVAIELKVWRDGRPDPLIRGLEQLDGYLGKLGLGTGWLVIFDRREQIPPIEERITTELRETLKGRSVVVVRG
ncbi:ATP-binding protein [cf. Phormidesmis sp. LEGE 11477]|uniref:ATP-binding protein n=1 Tax=cf. Phormidesmis sp. LEGE 11477 TaxID=1828680 RepID=UPI001881A7FE|nr:ATP-binding protein [cf. Phormidesmis sp. LEGE 11477]MBE9060770.1 ATP-binding protein [cf. Phormidesmis sp. LEGE 11477]